MKEVRVEDPQDLVDPDFRLSILIHDVSRMMHTLFDRSMKPRGITRSQWVALGQLARNKDGRMNQTQLARHLEVGKVAVNVAIDRLEKSGHVKRYPNKDDRRMGWIVITEQGHAVLAEMAQLARELDSKIFRAVPREDLGTIETFLYRIKNNLRAELWPALDRDDT